jgi:hypothetical protein
LNQLLTNEYGVTINEFLHSGLQEALCNFLTMQAPEEGQSELSQKDASNLLLRNKTFVHLVVEKTNNQSPYKKLIVLNHDALS